MRLLQKQIRVCIIVALSHKEKTMQIGPFSSSEGVQLLQVGFFVKNAHLRRKQGVCHTVPLPFTLKSILKIQNKKCGNSNISPCKNIIFKKILSRNQKSFKISQLYN